MSVDTAQSSAIAETVPPPEQASPQSPNPPEAPEPQEKTTVATKVKHGLLKAIDISALGFLEPIVRLCYGEEPRVQLRKIGRFIVLPTIAFVVFLGLWAAIAPSLKTKYGSLPTPAEVWSGWCSIMTFHDRETAKSEAYIATGEERKAILEKAEARRALLAKASKVATERVEQARVQERERKDERKAPVIAEIETLEAKIEAETARRRAALDERSRSGTPAERAEIVDEIAALGEWEKAQDERVSKLEAKLKDIEDKKDPDVVDALRVQTEIAEERQFNEKLLQVAGRDSRETKLRALVGDLKADHAALAVADPDSAYAIAQSITRKEDRLRDVAESNYARPWTLPMQIVRSILTVFSGFLIGVLIAIPLGVLCGLSSTFMAMVTPFIALFKPVSPIVWLLIFWIIVGGVFPDPDNSPALQLMNTVANAVISVIPYAGGIIDDIDINPAFIASALTVAMCSLWATMVNTALGVASVDKDHLNVARVLRLSTFDKLRKIVLPSALPLVFAGMRISLGIGWMVLIAAELLASSEGLGKFTNDMFQNGNTDSFAKIMVMVFVVGVIGLVLDRIMIVFQRLVSFEGSVATV